jgi:MFS family permease
MDLSPLRRRDFRLLYVGQAVSFFGSMMSYVGLPYVLYQATKSTILTGVLGVIQLVPSVVGGLLGGTLADAMDRRKLILICETGMALVVLALAVALSVLAPGYPHPLLLLGASALLAVFNGFHRPALEALTPRLVEAHEQTAAATLSSVRNNLGMIGGPALAGVLLSVDPVLVFYLDALSFAICVACLVAMRNVPKAPVDASLSGAAMREGFRYALSRQEFVGTYVVDIVAMTFSMPNLLFPAVAESLGAPEKLGWLHVALASGALVATLTAHRFIASRRHGVVILSAAFAWSCCMIGFGLAREMPVAIGFLLLAGFADMISGVYRLTIWNQTIPDALRGRLAGIEMISYLTGPMLGNTQLGVLAKVLGVQPAVAWSSVAGAAGVLAVASLLPGFRRYVAPLRATAPEPAGPVASASEP